MNNLVIQQIIKYGDVHKDDCMVRNGDEVLICFVGGSTIRGIVTTEHNINASGIFPKE